MRIRTRLLIFSAVLVFGSMFALLAASGLLFSHFGDKVAGGRPLPEAVTGEAVFAAGELLNGEAAAAADWRTLGEQLGEHGFRLYIRTGDGGEPFPPEPAQTAPYLKSLSPAVGRVALYLGNRAVMAAGKRLLADGTDYTAIAYFAMPMDDRAFKAIRANFIVSGFAALMAILLLSQFFTRALVKKMMTPVDRMIAGARRIEGGNLSEPIDYRGGDEFGTLCEAFNRMQAHLLKEREKNAAYERARTEMFADISHDLRTPLTSVKGFIKGVLDGVADTPEKRGKYLSIAYKKASDIDALLNRVSFFSKIETGNLPITAVRTDLAEYIERFARDSFEDFDVRVETDTASGAGIFADIDPDNTRRVLNNLLENAIKYAKADPLRVTIGLTARDGRAVIRFADNGGGIAEDKLPHVFERFFRADEARSSKNSEGSGLGLYIVKHIVEAQGGEVEAKNDGGFVVLVTLPLCTP